MIASASSPWRSRRALRAAAARRSRSSKSPVPSPWIAETAIGSPKPRRENSPGTDGQRARRFGLVGDEHDRPARAAQDRRDVVVERIAARSARRRRRRRRRLLARPLRLAAASRRQTRSPCAASASGSMPAVSTTLKVRPRHSHRAYRRSRVTPGVSSTIASRWPISRLKSALLPTFGPPDDGDGCRPEHAAGRRFLGLHGRSIRKRAVDSTHLGRTRGPKRNRRQRALMPSIYIETFGCQMNEADSQYIARSRVVGRLRASRPSPKRPTCWCSTRARCAITPSGAPTDGWGISRRSRTPIRGARLVVMGCLGRARPRPDAGVSAPHVDAVFGTQRTARARRSARSRGVRIVRRRSASTDERDAADAAWAARPMPSSDAFSHLRAFVNVQRGCSYYCTFCIVPHVRGRFDHRPLREILDEVRAQSRSGAREVMLVGQTVNAWKDPATGADFGDLCKAVAAIAGLERLTFISPHPKDFTEKILARSRDDSADQPARASAAAIRQRSRCCAA